MNMKNAVRQYNFMKKEFLLARYSNWFKGGRAGSPSGFTGIRKKVLRVSKTGVVHQNESGEKPPSIWLKRSLHQR